MEDYPKSSHRFVRRVAIFLGVISHLFACLGVYALLTRGWSIRVLLGTLSIFFFGCILLIAGIRGKGSIPSKGYSLIGPLQR